MNEPKPKVLAILGPTATGKTDLAIEIARRHDVKIISMDSALVYKDMNIGTAKPDPDTLKQYPHALVNVVTPEENFSAANFAKDATSVIKQAHAAQQTPLIVGGTMLYFKALMQGFDNLPEADEQIRKRLQVQLQEHGSQYLHQQLTKVDPQSANKIHTNDPQRLIRALEIHELTGYPMSQLHTHQEQADYYHCMKIVLLPRDRSFLHARIAKRFKLMIQQGFIQEVEGLRRKYRLTENLPSMRAVGYRQAWQYLDDQLSAIEFEEKSIIATRQLAKRQHTWLRKEKESTIFNIEDNYFDDALHLVDTFLSNN